MPSLSTLTPISKNKDVTPDDINVIYGIINGSYSTSRGPVTETTKKGLGISVQLTGYDGRLSTGLIDVSRYALEVRNREATAQKTFAARRADNKIVFAVEGGLAYAVKDTDGATSPTQVIVHGTTAGGVLSGTYPNPTFPYASEYARIYPTMIVAWYGSSSTTVRSGNLEVTDAPGWVFCNAATGTVTLRSGASLAVPDMTDRLPIGVGAVSLGGTSGNTWASSASISVAHGHGINAHQHTIATHTHGIPTHTHTIGTHFHAITNTHSHGLNSHVHTAGAHTHPVADHFHTLSAHTHQGPSHQHSGASMTVSGTAAATGNINGLATAGGVNLPTTGHTHAVSGTVGGNTEFAGTGATGIPSFANTSTVSGVNATAGSGNTGAPDTGVTGVTAAAAASTSDNNVGGSSTDANVSPLNTDGSGTLATSIGSDGTSTASQTGITTVNIRPPVLGWHWILKL